MDEGVKFLEGGVHSSTLAEGTTDYAGEGTTDCAGEVHVIHCLGTCLHLPVQIMRVVDGQ